LTKNGFVTLERVQQVLRELGEAEDQIFKVRQDKELNFRRREKEKKRAQKRAKLDHDFSSLTPLMRKYSGYDSGSNYSTPNFSPRNRTPMGRSPYQPSSNSSSPYTPANRSYSQSSNSRGNSGYNSNERAAADLRSMLMRKHDPDDSVEEQKDDEEEEHEEPVDDIRLWEEGWRDRYYLYKFGVSKQLSGQRVMKTLESKWLGHMSADFVGFSVIIIRAAHLGNGIFHITTRHSLLILLTLLKLTSHLRKEQALSSHWSS